MYLCKKTYKFMKKPTIQETSIALAKQWVNSGTLENDLLLLDRMNEVPFPQEPRRMNFILIALCTGGQVRYTMDTQQLEVTPGDIIIAGERHVIDNYEASPDLEGFCFIVSVEFFHEIIKTVSDSAALFLLARQHPVLHLKERDQQVFKDYFSAIRQRIQNTENHYRRDLIRTLMLALFYDLSNVVYHFQQNSSKNTSRADLVFTRFIKMVEENCIKERRVSWYAKQLDITPKYLSECVRRSSNRTPNEWIDNYVIMELRVQLKNSTKNIREIAVDMNFANQSFLGKYFKEHTGMSPSEYRRS